MDKIVAISAPDSAPIKRLVNEAKEAGQLIDQTNGRKTRSVVTLVEGYVVLAAIEADTLVERVEKQK
jgi:regulator of extracellular matrix RemA (YlzA/DUF370 family)